MSMFIGAICLFIIGFILIYIACQDLDETDKNITLFVISMICFIASPIVAHIAGIQEVQKDAVKQGVAEYYVDNSGELKWRWKPSSEKDN